MKNFMYFRIAILIFCFAEVNSATIPANICDNCDLENGVGYKANPDNCRRFVQCKKEDFGSNIIVYDKACNDGLFWNQKLKNCVPFPKSDCYKGECNGNKTLLFYSMSCGAYFNCTNGIVETKCCPQSTPEFDAFSKTCKASTTCPFQCTDDEKTPRSLECTNTYKTHTMANGIINPCKYEVHEGAYVKIMDCAAGTNFDSAKCLCSIVPQGPCPDLKVVNACDPDFDLDFTKNVIIDTASGAWIQNIGGVSIKNEYATFSGLNSQRLTVTRYSNIDFALPLAIKVRYRETSGRDNMVVLSTGGCIDRPGLYITVGNGNVTLGIVTEDGGYTAPLKTSAPTAGINQWKEVVLYFDGWSLSGVVRNMDSNGVNVVGSSIRIPKTVPSSATQSKFL
ncbi:protein PIF [Patella vulgata]|uniref:protein PIF n=1 Tax=Patella vulgata TaxID=6465 RepID=UPI0021808B78|nr:protein PIF [Patella vulgata]